MAQRRKEGVSQPSKTDSIAESSKMSSIPQKDSIDGRDNNNLLNPAPQHPLYANSKSPTRPSFETSQASRLQRRKKLASEGESSNSINQGDRFGNDLPRGKADIDLPKKSALDRLEGWFGIADSVPSVSSQPIVNKKSQYSVVQQSVTRSKAPQNPNKTTTLVLVHTVASTDTLEALALRYNSDVRTLRKANGLWPGDKVQIRKEIYIPVNEDAAQTKEIGSSGINGDMNGVQMQHASEEANGKLNLLNSRMNDQPRHLRSLSSASASSSATTSNSYAQSASATSTGLGLGLNASSVESGSASIPPELRRVPILSLSHFPPPGQISTTVGDNKESEESKAFGFGMGMKPDENMKPGESGVEDLLQLAERARLRGSEPSPPVQTPMPTQQFNSNSTKRPDLNRQQSIEQNSTASSPSMSMRGLDDEWKPNKYTLGQRRRQGASNAASGSSSNPTTDANSLSTGYQGWNDIPEPPLSKTAKGQVAHAYKSKRKYPRPGIVGVEMPGSTLIEDLAAGLPANSGPAANWARPIGESLPIPAENSRHRAPSTSSNSPNNQGWGQILSDTVRGKIRLEDALERGWDDLRSGLLVNGSGSDSNGLQTNRISRSSANTQGINSDLTPQRPSAEMARVALSGSGDRTKSPGNHSINGNQSSLIRSSNTAQNAASSSNSSLQVDSSTGASMRRQSGRSLHELEDLRVQNNESSQYPKTWSSASRPSDRIGGNGKKIDCEETTSSQTNARRNVRNIDWLG